MKKVYIAGPHVFLPNAVEWFAKATATCLAHGLVALTPLNEALTTPKEIFEYNKALIIEADLVLADVTPFRGSEPDSGTVWEIGFAHALGKPVFMHSVNSATMSEKAQRHFQLVGGDACTLFPDGMTAESFGYNTNLMLAMSSAFIWADFDDAVVNLAKHVGRQTWLDKDRTALAA